jgi:tetratricopeptide (TPR) repeat protein
MKITKYFRSIPVCIALFSLLLSFSSIADAQTKKDRKAADKLVDQARKAFGQKNYRMAVDQYTQALTLVPVNADAHYGKGLSHFYLKENDLALPEFELALGQGYKKPLDIYRARWWINFENKNYDAALADLQNGLKLDPKNVEMLIGLGDVNVAKSNFKDALDAYQKAVLQTPDSGDLYYSIARAQFNIGDTTGQATAAEEAVKKRTRFLGESFYLIGDAYQKQRKMTESLDAYQRAISAKPDIYLAYRNMAEIYRSQNRINEAIEISLKGRRLFPNDGGIYTNLGWYYSLADRHEDAVQASLAGTKLIPNEYLAFTNLCRAYNDVNKPDMAITACNTALKLNPNDGETNFYLGRAQSLAGRPDEATKNYRRAVTGLITYTRDNPQSSDGFYLLGNAYFADNQREKAIEAYLKCLSLNPRFSKARFNLGIVQVLQKNKNAALEQYNSLLGLDQNLAGKLKTEIDKL